jgi:2',3'-cyclic-nucleotide 2'-phosphodiesterase
MNILFVGDIFGSVGRDTLINLLPGLKKKYDIDFVAVNGENSAGGAGITPAISRELLSIGVDVITSGNHIWKEKDIIEYIKEEPYLLRPANYPSDVPGAGSVVWVHDDKKIAVVNLLGRIFMPQMDCPFRIGLEEIEKLRKTTRIIIVDIHAEATSEKVAMGWFLDGKVSAVLGTHTHVQTADEKILPQGCAYITDVGMTGPTESVIGINKDIAIKKFLTNMPFRFEPGKGKGILCAVVVQIEDSSGRALSIKRIQEFS